MKLLLLAVILPAILTGATDTCEAGKGSTCDGSQASTGDAEGSVKIQLNAKDGPAQPKWSPPYGELPPSPASPTGFFIESQVPRAQLHPKLSESFTAKVAKLDKPIVLQNTPSMLWRANKKWNMGYLAEKLRKVNNAQLDGVKKTKHPNNYFFYYHHAPMNAHPALVTEYKLRTFRKVNLTAIDYFRLLDPNLAVSDPTPIGAEKTAGTAVSKVEKPVPGLKYSYAGKLDDWGDLFQDVLPVEPLMLKPPEFDPENQHLFRQTYVWAGPKGAVTPVHFDLFHNFYHQISGFKQFLLFPPEAWEKLYLWPILHPGGRSSQLDTSKVNPQEPLNANEKCNIFDSSTAAECIKAQEEARQEQRKMQANPSYKPKERFKYPHFTGVKAYEAILGPGDVLYIPPLWFHHVTAIENSVSVSVWSPYEGTELSSQLLEDVPLPIRASAPLDYRVMTLRIYLESLVESLKLDMNVAAFVHWTLLESRYKHVGTVSLEQPPTVQRFCHDDEVQKDVLESSQGVITDALKKVVAAFKKLATVAGTARRDLFLTDYFELCAAEIVGAENAKQFFHDLVYC